MFFFITTTFNQFTVQRKIYLDPRVPTSQKIEIEQIPNAPPNAHGGNKRE